MLLPVMEIWEYDLWLATACRRAQIQRSIKSIFAFVFLAYFFFILSPSIWLLANLRPAYKSFIDQNGSPFAVQSSQNANFSC